MISVVMPVHNAGPFLDESIRSILDQTLGDFEFTIVDDASSDESLARIRDWARRDSRIHVVHSPTRLGLCGSSNLAVAQARTEIVARMDADDMCHPDRLRRQWQVLSAAPDVVLVGTLADGINADGDRVRPRDRWRIVRRSPFVPFPHGSIMFRKSAFNAAGAYDETTSGLEDHHLFHRIAALGRLVTLPDLLYRYRYHSQNSTLSPSKPGLNSNGFGWARATNRHYARGAMQLWAGMKPQVLNDVLQDLRNGSTNSGSGRGAALTARQVALLGWAAWAEISPATLRFALRTATAVRDRISSLVVKDGQPYEWRFDHSS